MSNLIDKPVLTQRYEIRWEQTSDYYRILSFQKDGRITAMRYCGYAGLQPVHPNTGETFWYEQDEPMWVVRDINPDDLILMQGKKINE